MIASNLSPEAANMLLGLKLVQEAMEANQRRPLSKLERAAQRLARIGLGSERYASDGYYRACVDRVLELTKEAR